MFDYTWLLIVCAACYPSLIMSADKESLLQSPVALGKKAEGVDSLLKKAKMYKNQADNMSRDLSGDTILELLKRTSSTDRVVEQQKEQRASSKFSVLKRKKLHKSAKKTLAESQQQQGLNCCARTSLADVKEQNSRGFFELINKNGAIEEYIKALTLLNKSHQVAQQSSKKIKSEFMAEEIFQRFSALALDLDQVIMRAEWRPVIDLAKSLQKQPLNYAQIITRIRKQFRSVQNPLHNIRQETTSTSNAEPIKPPSNLIKKLTLLRYLYDRMQAHEVIDRTLVQALGVRGVKLLGCYQGHKDSEALIDYWLKMSKKPLQVAPLIKKAQVAIGQLRKIIEGTASNGSELKLLINQSVYHVESLYDLYSCVNDLIQRLTVQATAQQLLQYKDYSNKLSELDQMWGENAIPAYDIYQQMHKRAQRFIKSKAEKKEKKGSYVKSKGFLQEFAALCDIVPRGDFDLLFSIDRAAKKIYLKADGKEKGIKSEKLKKEVMLFKNKLYDNIAQGLSATLHAVQEPSNQTLEERVSQILQLEGLYEKCQDMMNADGYEDRFQLTETRAALQLYLGQESSPTEVMAKKIEKHYKSEQENEMFFAARYLLILCTSESYKRRFDGKGTNLATRLLYCDHLSSEQEAIREKMKEMFL